MTEDEAKTQLVRDYKDTFGGLTGQRVLADLAKVCGESARSFDAASTHQTAFNEGARSAVLYIRRKLDTDLGKPEPTRTVDEEVQ